MANEQDGSCTVVDASMVSARTCRTLTIRVVGRRQGQTLFAVDDDVKALALDSDETYVSKYGNNTVEEEWR